MTISRYAWLCIGLLVKLATQAYAKETSCFDPTDAACLSEEARSAVNAHRLSKGLPETKRGLGLLLQLAVAKSKSNSDRQLNDVISFSDLNDVALPCAQSGGTQLIAYSGSSTSTNPSPAHCVEVWTNSNESRTALETAKLENLVVGVAFRPGFVHCLGIATFAKGAGASGALCPLVGEAVPTVIPTESIPCTEESPECASKVGIHYINEARTKEGVKALETATLGVYAKARRHSARMANRQKFVNLDLDSLNEAAFIGKCGIYVNNYALAAVPDPSGSLSTLEAVRTCAQALVYGESTASAVFSTQSDAGIFSISRSTSSDTVYCVLLMNHDFRVPVNPDASSCQPAL